MLAQPLFDTLSDEIRRNMLLLLMRDGEQCVCDIAEHIGSERSNVSRHLSVMVSAGVLSWRKEGLKVIYSLKTPCILDCLSCISECLKQQIQDSQRMLKAM